jgi:hypothetical protein
MKAIGIALTKVKQMLILDGIYVVQEFLSDEISNKDVCCIGIF